MRDDDGGYDAPVKNRLCGRFRGDGQSLTLTMVTMDGVRRTDDDERHCFFSFLKNGALCRNIHQFACQTHNSRQNENNVNTPSIYTSAISVTHTYTSHAARASSHTATF